VVDYSKIKIDFDHKSKQLKMERVRLLQEKIKEKTGKDIRINLLNGNLNSFFSQVCKKSLNSLYFEDMPNRKDNLNNVMNAPFKTNTNNTTVSFF
jgi:hypothetical protein